MNLENGEHIILDEGKCGRHTTLTLTNRRLLFLNKDKIEDEIALADVAEVYADTQVFTNMTQLKIRTLKGIERKIIFKSGGGLGLLLGGDDYITQKGRSITDRYAVAITRAVDSLPKQAASQQTT